MVGKQMTEGYFVRLLYVVTGKAGRQEKETQSGKEASHETPYS
jgi:hypothetical protein